jgi:hypothetical protein
MHDRKREVLYKDICRLVTSQHPTKQLNPLDLS